MIPNTLDKTVDDIKLLAKEIINECIKSEFPSCGKDYIYCTFCDASIFGRIDDKLSHTDDCIVNIAKKYI